MVQQVPHDGDPDPGVTVCPVVPVGQVTHCIGQRTTTLLV
jgi:hypothetical protein